MNGKQLEFLDDLPVCRHLQVFRENVCSHSNANLNLRIIFNCF